MAKQSLGRLYSQLNSRQFVTAMLAPALLFVSSVFSVAWADQNSAELPPLFEELSTVDDLGRASQIQQSVWELWLTGPDSTSHNLMLQIQTALQQGRPEVGLLLSEQLIDSYPQFAEAWNKRATFYFMLNRLEESVEDIQTTLKLEPNHFGALSGLGLILMRTGDAEGALAAFEAVLEINPLSLSAQQNAAQAKDKLGTEI